MNNLKTVRELQKVLECAQNLINNLTPAPDITQVDYEQQFELGTRYILSDGTIFKYVKLDAGIVGKTNEGEELRVIEHRWVRYK